MRLGGYLIGRQRFILTLTSVVLPLRACLLPCPQISPFVRFKCQCHTSPSVKEVRRKTTHSILRNLVLKYGII